MAMNTEKGNRINEIFSSLAITYGLSRWEKTRAASYAALLGGLFSEEEIRNAVRLHQLDPDRGHRFPLPSDIAYQIVGDPEETAAELWRYAAEAARNPDAKHRLRNAGDQRSRDVIEAVEAIGGWQILTAATAANMPFMRRDFVAALALILKKRNKNEALRKIRELRGEA